MHDGAFRVIEHLREVVPLASSEKLAFLELIHGLNAFFVSDSFFSALFSFSVVQALIGFSVSLIGGHTVKFFLNITAQILALNSLPLITVSLDSIEGQADLLRREFTILAKSIKTDHVLDVVSSEWLRFDLWTVELSVLILLIVGLALLLSVSLSVVMISPLFLLLD